MKQTTLAQIADFASKLCRANLYKDYEPAHNGLQVENSGKVSKIACAVDAGLFEIQAAAEARADLLIVHHGLFWDFTPPIVGATYEKISTLIKNDIALFAMHLPLDRHPEIGNNAQIAKALNLDVVGTCCPFGGADIAMKAKSPKGGREEIAKRLQGLFPDTFKAIEFGSDKPKNVVICSGSSGDVVPHLHEIGADTFICGELRQRHYSMAQELKLNLYPCGHYATETFGVRAFTAEIAKKFKLEHAFIYTENPL